MPPPVFDLSQLRTALGDTLEARFEVGARVASGTSTDVVAARDRELGRIVAVKIVRDDAPESEVRRIIVEAQVAAQLTHPNVVPLYSLEVTTEGKPTFTMQRVRGETLANHIERCVEARDPKDGQYSLRRRMEIFLGVCDAIAFAHTHGVYHRNLGPSSVMLGPFAEVFVTDWGFALLGESGMSKPVALTVSPPSVSGDVARAATPVSTARSARDVEAERRDRHALGMLLAELITLAPRVGSELPPPAATRARRRVPRALRAVAHAAVKGELYQDVRGIADDVRRYLRGESTLVRPDMPATRMFRRLIRRPVAIAAALLLGVVAVGGFAIVRRVRLLDGEIELGTRRATLARISGAVTARADRLDAIAYEVSTELYGARAALSLTTSSTTVDETLRSLSRRTSALRAFVVVHGTSRVIGVSTPDLSKLTPRGTADARWDAPLKRAPHEPWVVPLLADLTWADGRPSGVIGLDVPLATLAVLTSMSSVDGLRSLRILDSRGRGVDAQGYLASAADPALDALIGARTESDILTRDGVSLAIARVHALGWYMVGEAETAP